MVLMSMNMLDLSVTESYKVSTILVTIRISTYNWNPLILYFRTRMYISQQDKNSSQTNDTRNSSHQQCNLNCKSFWNLLLPFLEYF